MSDEDTLVAECLDERVQALTTSDASTVWWDARRAAQRRSMIEVAAEELREGPKDSSK
jgi:hypothetical protein